MGRSADSAHRPGSYDRGERKARVTVPSVTERGDALSRVRRENQTLYAVIGMVSSSLSLDRVLGGIVDIATDATDCHACFIYFVEDETLVLRAASPRYAHLVGRLSWGLDEGLTGWVARTKTPAFIRENALADPRMKYVPEIEEDRFQSMVAVPIVGKGDRVIGVIVLHTKAPREFEDDVLNFLVHTAWLVAGAIQNAQLYEETRRRVDELTTLTQISQTLAAVTDRDGLYRAVTRGARQLLSADSCQIWRLSPEDDELSLAVTDPADADSAASKPGRAALLLDLMRREKSAHDGLLVAPLVAGDEQLGIICCVTGGGRTFTDEDAELLQAVADQTAVGLKKAELIERLTAEHVVKDMFDALESGTLATAEAKAGEARWDFSRPHALLRIERAPENTDGPPWPELAVRARAQLRRRYPLGLFDDGRESMRAIVPLPTGDADAAHRLREACDELARNAGLTIGISEVDRGVAGAARRTREAVDAATVGRSLAARGGALAYGQIGAYRYLVHMELDEAPQDCYGRAVEELMRYDRRRNAQLVETLECYLDSRSSVAASGRALFIHPNTVRQRLERIESITGLDLHAADLLSLELALKLARLRGGA
jgi:GAF domain-containing protein